MAEQAAISTLLRGEILDTLERERFDCVVIGGGITGAGIAREASLRGLSVALLEAEDFASGTSSRSSKLIHGGLRYLAMADVSLVRETALERKEIFRLAPHLAERRWMIVPSRSRAGMMKMRVGIAAYEKLGAVESVDRHMNWGDDDLAREEPLLQRSRYPYACTYREYLTDDARLVLANLRGARLRGAVAINHAPVTRIPLEGGSAAGVEATCKLTGRTVFVRSRIVINAAGPWVEAVRQLEDPQASPLLVLSKGIHIVLPLERLPLRNMVVLGTQDSRSIFAIPRGRICYVGTTDTAYGQGAEVWPEIHATDVEYLLEPLPRYFDVEPLKLEDVNATWAGLRPLIDEPGKKTTEISRRDEILIGPGRVVSLAGGKLTGYRPMARRAVEQVEELLNRPLSPRQDEEPLPGGDFDGDLDALAASLSGTLELPPDVSLRLARLYGDEARAVAAGGRDRLGGSGVLSGEVDWAIEQEGAATLEDLIYRRTRVALWEPDERDGLIEPAADRMAELLGWSNEHKDKEITKVRRLIEAELAFARPQS